MYDNRADLYARFVLVLGRAPNEIAWRDQEIFLTPRSCGSLIPPVYQPLRRYRGERGMKALIVDDDRDLLDVMTYALRREGYEVTGGMDGLQAIDRMREDEPDIVILDVRLPRLNGFEGCRRIRHISEVPV